MLLTLFIIHIHVWYLNFPIAKTKTHITVTAINVISHSRRFFFIQWLIIIGEFCVSGETSEQNIITISIYCLQSWVGNSLFTTYLKISRLLQRFHNDMLSQHFFCWGDCSIWFSRETYLSKFIALKMYKVAWKLKRL